MDRAYPVTSPSQRRHEIGAVLPRTAHGWAGPGRPTALSARHVEVTGGPVASCALLDCPGQASGQGEGHPQGRRCREPHSTGRGFHLHTSSHCMWGQPRTQLVPSGQRRLTQLCGSRVEAAWPGAGAGQMLWDVHSHVVTETTQRTYVYQPVDTSTTSTSMGGGGSCECGLSARAGDSEGGRRAH